MWSGASLFWASCRPGSRLSTCSCFWRYISCDPDYLAIWFRAVWSSQISCSLTEWKCSLMTRDALSTRALAANSLLINKNHISLFIVTVCATERRSHHAQLVERERCVRSAGSEWKLWRVTERERQTERICWYVGQTEQESWGERIVMPLSCVAL